MRSPDATPKQKRHLVDGVWVDKLPFSARDAWLAEQAEKARFKAEVEAWEAKEAESPSPVKAEPVVHGEEIPAERSWPIRLAPRILTQAGERCFPEAAIRTEHPSGIFSLHI